MIQKDLYKEIRNIILQETVFLRHYIGKVIDINDKERLGRVQVEVLDLGLEGQEEGLWCFPRDKNSMTVPKKDDWVEVYFVRGSCDMPVYMGTANEIKDMVPKNYKSPITQIIFEDPSDDGVFIKYDQTQKKLFINAKFWDFNDGELTNC